MNVERFIAERTPVWQRLEQLLAEAEIKDPTSARLHDIVELYRRTASDLNRARSHTANPELLGYLNQLTGRAYRLIYGAGHRAPVWRSLVRLIVREIPAAFRRERLAVAAAAAALLLGALFGSAAVLIDPANGPRLVPAQFFTERPRDRVQHIEENRERIDSVEKAALFGASLYVHNIKVACLTFSVGAVTIIGGLWLLFYNGTILGAIATMYILDGVPGFFFAWVGPHGALELPAIVFGGAAGLLTGRALLMPGNLTRQASVRRVLPSVWRMMTAAAMTLVLAGIIEGSFSQFSAKSLPYALKIAVASLLFVALLAWLFFRRVDEA
ncbi:MAG: stage II sporulation protein M [Acidobacteriota bacterium]